MWVGDVSPAMDSAVRASSGVLTPGERSAPSVRPTRHPRRRTSDGARSHPPPARRSRDNETVAGASPPLLTRPPLGFSCVQMGRLLALLALNLPVIVAAILAGAACFLSVSRCRNSSCSCSSLPCSSRRVCCLRAACSSRLSRSSCCARLVSQGENTLRGGGQSGSRATGARPAPL